jgi:RND family efflux transporter MFP subunit
MKNFLFLTLLLLVFQQSALASSHQQQKINIIPEKLTTAEFYEKYTAVGQAKLANSKDYFAKVKGKVDFISSIQGNKIAKGDIVIIIDKEIAEKLKSQAEANLYLAESTHNRNLSLLKKNIINVEVINKSKASLEQAKNEYVKALKTYDDMVIKAMEEGYIGVIRANIADEVKEGDYLFSITTKSNFYIFAELPEILRGRILTSDTVSAHGKNDKIILGQILAVSNYLSNSGTVTVKFEFPYDDSLVHGAFVETDIIFNKHHALALPEKAVLKNNQGDFVYVITPENKVKQVFVTLGVRTNSMIELLSNELKEGDMIVLDGLTKVYDGAEVIINSKTEHSET